MDDPDMVWPAWKFGMKRDDLFTTLHDQYNTFSYTLQDPEAFHHDVYEVSRMADTAEEFHRFMADRQRQRITELTESLESLAVEIIANPKLMGTDQWQYALQLFRTKSFDSVVRYFASYLPDEYLDRHAYDGSVTSSTSSYSETDSISTKASSATDASSPFLDDFFSHESAMTDEPCVIDDYHQLPLSPDSEAVCARSSDSSVYAPTMSSTNPPSRSMSFSGSESGRLSARFSRRRPMRMGGNEDEDAVDDDEDEEDETSQSDECDMTLSSVCDSAETRSSCDPIDSVNVDVDVDVPELSVRVVDCEEEGDEEGNDHEHGDEDFPTAQYPEDDVCIFDTRDAFNTYDTLDSDTSTPRQVHDSTCYVEYKSAVSQVLLPSPSSRRGYHRRSRSPSPRSYLVQRAEKNNNNNNNHSHDIRRSPEEALSKIQKTPSSSDPSRKRPRGSRWLD